MKKRTLKQEIRILCFILAFVALTFLYSQIPCMHIVWIDSIVFSSNSPDLLLDLFTVQATVAALSISIIAIITGFQTETYYGVGLTNYITTLKPILFKHKNLMIADLIMIFANYIAVSLQCYYLSVDIFAVSILISIILVKDTAFVFKKGTDIKQEIREYVLHNYSVSYITDLIDNISKQMYADNLLPLEDGFELLKEIYKDAVQNQNEEVIDLICKSLSVLFSEKYGNTAKEKVFLLLWTINEVYAISNEPQTIRHIEIWDRIYVDFCDFLHTITPTQMRRNRMFDYYAFGINLMKNKSYRYSNGRYISQNSMLAEFYYVYIYTIVVAPNQVSEEGQSAEEMIRSIYFWYSSYISADTDEQKEDAIKGYGFFLKQLVDNQDERNIRKLYLNHAIMHFRNNKEGAVFVALFVYAYYLAFCEVLVEGQSIQRFAQDLIKSMQGLVHKAIYALNIKDILKENGKILRNLLNSWEKFNTDELKEIVMERVLVDVLLYISVEKYFSEDDLYDCLKYITSGDMEYTSLKYFANGDDDFVANFMVFQQRALGFTEQSDMQRKVDTLRSALQKGVKAKQVEVAEHYPLTQKVTKEFVERIKTRLNEAMNEIIPFSFNENCQANKSEKIALDYCQVDQDCVGSNYLLDDVCRLASYRLFDRLETCLGEHVEILKLKNTDRTKQEQFIEKSTPYIPNVFIGNKHTFWEENDQFMLQNYIDAMEKVDFSCGCKRLYLINSNLVSFRVSQIHIECFDYTESDFDTLNIEKSGNDYFYSRSNGGVKAKYEKKELLDLLHKTLKKIHIEVEYEYGFQSDFVGCSLEIEYM